jgi:hypothetical protein
MGAMESCLERWFDFKAHVSCRCGAGVLNHEVQNAPGRFRAFKMDDHVRPTSLNTQSPRLASLAERDDRGDNQYSYLKTRSDGDRVVG